MTTTAFVRVAGCGLSGASLSVQPKPLDWTLTSFALTPAALAS